MIEGALNQMVVDMLDKISIDIHNNLVEQEKVNPEAMETLYDDY